MDGWPGGARSLDSLALLPPTTTLLHRVQADCEGGEPRQGAGASTGRICEAAAKGKTEQSEVEGEAAEVGILSVFPGHIAPLASSVGGVRWRRPLASSVGVVQCLGYEYTEL